MNLDFPQLSPMKREMLKPGDTDLLRGAENVLDCSGASEGTRDHG
jgi:hypothetical protein